MVRSLCNHAEHAILAGQQHLLLAGIRSSRCSSSLVAQALRGRQSSLELMLGKIAELGTAEHEGKHCSASKGTLILDEPPSQAFGSVVRTSSGSSSSTCSSA